MKPFRGLTKDGTMVYGWLAEIEGKYFIIDIKAELRPLTAYGKYGKPGEGWKEFFGTYGIAGFIEVIPESIAQQVGLKDKNGDEIYAGDRLQSGKRIFTVVWDAKMLQWRTKEEGTRFTWPLYKWAVSEQFEIIPPEVLENPK